MIHKMTSVFFTQSTAVRCIRLVFHLETQALRSLCFRPLAGLELRTLAYYVTVTLRECDVRSFCALPEVIYPFSTKAV